MTVRKVSECSHFLKILLCAVVVLSAGSCSDPKQAVHKFDYFAFGTLISLTIAGVDKTQAQAASDKLEAEFNRMHHDWHAWQPGPLMEINQAIGSGETVELNEEFSDLISRAMQLAENSQQTFHPGMGGLLKLWGFQSDMVPSKPPEKAILNKFMQQSPQLGDVIMSKLRMGDKDLNTVSIHSTNPNFQFDLGGFAKGYGIDRAIELLRSEGINNAIVNAGGDLRAIGQRSERPWRIGIRHPRGPGIMAYLDLHDDESVFTSGDYERYFFYEDTRYHHILDPRTGYPANELMSVTILTKEAALADAAATALLVGGSHDWREVAESMGITAAMVVDAQGQIQMTPAMAERLVLAVESINPENQLENSAKGHSNNHKHAEEHADQN